MPAVVGYGIERARITIFGQKIDDVDESRIVEFDFLVMSGCFQRITKVLANAHGRDQT